MKLKLNFRTLLYIAAFSLFMLAGSAFASTSSTADAWSISELKLGFLKHDVDNIVDFTSAREEDGGLDMNVEALFYSPRFLPSWLGKPRPNIGASINTEGRTSQAYIGLQWEYAFDCGLFVNANGGFAIHDGRIDDGRFDANHITDKRLGSRVLFHFAPEIGYRLQSGYGVSAYWEHSSNGQVLNGGGDTNQGLDNVGVRLSYLFGK